MALLLRTAIDRALVDGRSWRHFERLVRENPHAVVSSHVLHNLGGDRIAVACGRSPLFASLYRAAHSASLEPLGREASDSLEDAGPCRSSCHEPAVE